jgi:2-oxoglutarate/2-oxoacid ferredoxin oxidoreductase subunit alpha
VDTARTQGLNVGLVRPMTLYPFPYGILGELATGEKSILVVELNAGQMVEDVRLGVDGKVPVEFYGRAGGVIPTPDEVLNKIIEMSQQLGIHNAGEKSGNTVFTRWA